MKKIELPYLAQVKVYIFASHIHWINMRKVKKKIKQNQSTTDIVIWQHTRLATHACQATWAQKQRTLVHSVWFVMIVFHHFENYVTLVVDEQCSLQTISVKKKKKTLFAFARLLLFSYVMRCMPRQMKKKPSTTTNDAKTLWK